MLTLCSFPVQGKRRIRRSDGGRLSGFPDSAVKTAVLCERKREREGASPPGRAFCRDLTAHFFGELTGDGEPEAAAFCRSAFVAFIQPVKDMFQVFFFNTDTVVGKFEQSASLRRSEG